MKINVEPFGISVIASMTFSSNNQFGCFIITNVNMK